MVGGFMGNFSHIKQTCEGRKGDVVQQLTVFQHELRPLQCPFKPVHKRLGFPSVHSLTIQRALRQHLGEIPVLVLFPMGFWDREKMPLPSAHPVQRWVLEEVV